MATELIHIYGPIGIQSYGTAIATGVFFFLWRSSQHPWRKKITSQETYLESILVGIGLGVIGGRLLYALEMWHEFSSPLEIFYFWQDGYSILGSLVAILIGMPLYLRRKKIPVLPYFDLVSLYAPLLQSISRIGCFTAGCCGGITTNGLWFFSTHPTQLYSSGALFLIFLFLRFFVQQRVTKAGQLFCIYLILTSAQRGIIDFLRADRSFFDNPFMQTLSVQQWLALGLISVGIIYLAFVQKNAPYYDQKNRVS